ncbi:MAG: hypothetical protein Kow0099_24080 [Candidatus Abyssubacteria bacterium]
MKAAPDEFEHSLKRADSEHGDAWLVSVSNKPLTRLGPVSGHLKIRTSNTVQPVLDVPLSVNIVGEITVQPQRLFFGLVDPNDGAQRAIRLTSSKEPFRILGATSDVSFVRVREVSKEDSDGASRIHELVVRIVDTAPNGASFSGTVSIRTDNPYQREIRVPMSGKVAE